MHSPYNTACFVDTSFFYAIADQSDRWHSACKQILQDACQKSRPLTTTPFVVAETHALLLHRLGQHISTPWLGNIRSWVNLIPTSAELEERASEIIQQYADQQFTFTDALSFAVLDYLDIPIALSLDKHFVIYRSNFLTVPLELPHLP